jgi:c-di-GMP-binding flagellar brake protein YcgR
MLCVVVLQNCRDLQKVMQGSCGETCPESHDANQIISIKVEDVSDTEEEEEEEEDPMSLKYSRIKSEHEVSCMSVCYC